MLLGRVPAEPDVWTDGSLVDDKVSGVSSSGSGFFTGHPGRLWADRRLAHLDDGIGGSQGASVLSWLFVLFLVRYRLFREQSSGGSFLHFWPLMAFTLGLTTQGVVRHVGRLLDGDVGSRPPDLVKDEDLILLVGRMLRLRGLDTDEAMVRDGRVRESRSCW